MVGVQATGSLKVLEFLFCIIPMYYNSTAYLTAVRNDLKALKCIF